MTFLLTVKGFKRIILVVGEYSKRAQREEQVRLENVV